MAMKKSKILTEEMAKVRSRPQVSVVAASQCAPTFTSLAHRPKFDQRIKLKSVISV
jgi:hypothetical protein